MMRTIRIAATLLSVAILPNFLGQAQQTATKPVVTATPVPAAPQAPAMAEPSVPTPPGSNNADYVVGPGDALSVNVWKEPTVSGTLPVRPDGMISLPLVGDMPASGYTPMQLSAEISSRLRKFIQDPSVTVTVLSVNSKHVTLIGEIGKVGPIPLTAGMTPLEAIASAGGLGPFANAKHIYILRTAGGKQLKIPFDYKKAIKDGNMQGVTLIAGDTIVVP